MYAGKPRRAYFLAPEVLGGLRKWEDEKADPER